jgi:hypothetical protein
MKKLYIASATAAVMMICAGSFGVVRKAVAAAAATLVEIVLPAKPYSASSIQMGETGFEIFGPGGAVKFGITNITISNPSASNILVEVEALNKCSGEITESTNVIEYAVPASSTLVVPFPTPFVTNNFKNGNGFPSSFNTACIGIFDNGAFIMVTGFIE